MIQPLHGIAATPYHPVKPVRDRLYRQFITTFPCCAAKQHMDVQSLIQMFQQFYRLRFPDRHQETPIEKQEAA